ncbi:MAG TPA: hypothetical protein VMT24_11610 [Aggregatilineaceae bacterium]|nr:hypothetical protein [Aggregatilineaceae bacterium]
MFKLDSALLIPTALAERIDRRAAVLERLEGARRLERMRSRGWKNVTSMV